MADVDLPCRSPSLFGEAALAPSLKVRHTHPSLSSKANSPTVPTPPSCALPNWLEHRAHGVTPAIFILPPQAGHTYPNAKTALFLTIATLNNSSYSISKTDVPRWNVEGPTVPRWDQSLSRTKPNPRRVRSIQTEIHLLPRAVAA
jgi:hypothetical protein